MKKLASFLGELINPKSVFILALAFSVIAWYLSFTHNYIRTYNDAASHLNIARRIIDNYTPGIAQIGTVWLPLPHILMFFLAWNDLMWHTGLAGSLVSMTAYIFSVVFTYKTILVLSTDKTIINGKIGALLGALILALNPNLLYLQTTPMTETLLIATFVMSAYFLAKYIQTREMIHLILTGIFVMLSTLIRYDGWFLFATLSFFIPAFAIFKYGRRKAEGDLIIFIVIGGLGIVLWVLWNWAIFHDPLYFITGPYSAYAQQKVLKSVGQLPTASNIKNSIIYYVWSVIDNNGIFLVAATAITALVAPFLMKNKRQLIVLIAVLSPLIFNIIALYTGQSAMNVPQAPSNPGLFNIRYGIMFLPAISILLGFIASRVKFAWVLVIAVLIFQSTFFVKAGLPVALADGLYGLQQTYYTVEASSWLHDNYQGGLILTSLASNDAFVNRAQIDMKNYIQEGNGVYWDNALKNPSKNIKYIATLTFPADRVWQKIYNNKDFLKNYVEVHAYKEFKIYERKW